MRLSKLCAFVTAAALVLCISQFILEVYLNYEEPWLFPYLNLNSSEDISRIYEDVPFPVLAWWHLDIGCHQSWRVGLFRKCGHLTCYITPTNRFRNHPKFKLVGMPAYTADVTDPVIVWWAAIGGVSHYGSWSQCGQLTCFFTDLTQFRHHPNFKGYLFYGSFINWTHLPLPRDGDSVFWALMHEESPRNNVPLVFEPVISLFNYTATFSRHSDVPTVTQYLHELDSLTDMKYFRTVEAKNGYQKNETWLLAPVVYIQTDCSTTPNRDTYVAELSKYIRVDSYGRCLHNRNLPPHLQAPFTLKTMMSQDLLHIVGKYKFAIAIENAVCEDYITEKLWRPLITGTVPIYVGSPSVSDWLPNNRSAILGMDFESPKQLAEYLHYLNTHDDEYDSYRRHKLKSSVTNTRLVEEMRTRNYKSSSGKSFIEKFECFMCEKAHKEIREISVARTEHYSCEMPTSLLTRQPNVTNEWLSWWFSSRCEAQVVRRFVDSGVANYTIQEFNNAVNELMLANKCSYSEENARDLNDERIKSKEN